jgi:hypothetical protein
VGAQNLGVSVTANNAQALADALEKMLFDEKERKAAIKNISRVREDYFWDVALAPLTTFVSNAHLAADHRDIPSHGFTPASPQVSRNNAGKLTRIIRGAKAEFNHNGLRGVWNKLRKKLRGNS